MINMSEELHPNYNPNFRNCPSPPPSTAGEAADQLRRTIDDITSLISLSHTVRVFSVKWQLIRKRLDELNSGLIALENPQFDSYDQRIIDLVSLVSHTVKECSDLGLRCINVLYSGKLLMQSDLDKVIAKLDVCVDKFMGLYHTDGIISSGLALVVSRPVFGATRDDMRFYVKDLLNRLKIGDCQMKKQALISLNEVIIEDEKYVKIVVEIGDFVLMLAPCLDSNDSSIQEEAVISIGVISGFDCYKGVLVVSGVIAPLIRVLENGSLKAKEYSIRCLMKLTENGDNAWALSAHGGVTALLNLCSRDDYDDGKHELIGLSCWVLRNVVVVEEIKRFMIEDGAISTFIKLIKGRNEMAQIGSAEFVQSLAFGDESVCHLVIKEGGARALVRLLDPKSNLSFKVRETALRAIENLCFSSVDHVNLLISYGFLDQLLYFLRKGDISIQELAFKSASRLSATSEQARKSMGDVGFMAEFVKFLEAKSYNIREMASESLSSMVLVPKNRKKFSNDDHNIAIVLQLLDLKNENPGNLKFLLSILLSLCNCNHARRIISHSGYVKNIQKLSENGISDAKKIIRKLSTNRFKNLLNGILHS
ncbi:hypothetical protein RND81_10G027600 [Saponaria officinalis]|uniref:DUF7032 domain-containing protein n=1 Tax=Saponaria officinalis TaxID=3572 RepID=A0AAW1HZP4_SAPOF